MDAPQKTVAITLNNDDKTTPFLAQSWVTDADGVKTDALMALPPLQRIDAGQKSQVRITQVRGLTDKLPQDRETLFWFNVRGVPPKPGDNNVLQLAMQSQLKLFYRPKAIIRNSSDQPESCGVTPAQQKLLQEVYRGHTLAEMTGILSTDMKKIWENKDRLLAKMGMRNRLYELLNGTRFREDLQRTAFMAPAESDMMCNTEATAGNQRSRSARMTGHARPEYAVRDIAEYWCQLQREMDDN